MQTNQIFDVDILRYADNGEGICYLEDRIVFVKYAPKDCRVRIRIDEVHKKYINASMVEILSNKKALAIPVCDKFTKCGGCDLQYLSYSEQLNFKKEKVENAIKKFSGLSVKVLPVIASDITVCYRNKIQLHIGCVDKRVTVGFYDKGSRNIVSAAGCRLYGDWADRLIDVFLQWAEKHRFTVYNENNGRGILRNLIARYVEHKLVVTLVINADKIDFIDELKNLLSDVFDNFSLYVSVNKKKNSGNFGDKLIKIYDNDKPVTVDGIICEISPYSFFQINDNVRKKLYKEILKSVDNNNSFIIDAYSGIGVLSTQLAKKCGIVFGIEIMPEAVKNADELCRKNGFCPQITNLCGDAAIILPKLVSLLHTKKRKEFEEFIACNTFMKLDSEKYNPIFDNIYYPVTIVLDPPRKGCDFSVLQAVIESKADKIIYVSCDPVTLSRDLNILSADYKVIKVQPFDMFPYTHHVETVVLLSKVSKLSVKKA